MGIAARAHITCKWPGYWPGYMHFVFQQKKKEVGQKRSKTRRHTTVDVLQCLDGTLARILSYLIVSVSYEQAMGGGRTLPVFM